MRNILICWVLLPVYLWGQKTDLPEFRLPEKTMEQHLRFLAADELQGRMTGEQGGAVAARYIAEQFRKYGVKPVPGKDSYFQTVPFQKKKIAKSGQLVLGDLALEQGEGLMVDHGPAMNLETDLVFVGHAWIDPATGQNDFAGKNLEGKMLLALSGFPGVNDRSAILDASSRKMAWAQEHGAIGVIEIYSLNFPWQVFKRFMGGSRLQLAPKEPMAENLIHGWVYDPDKVLVEKVRNTPMTVSFSSEGVSTQKVLADNVIGIIEGTDPSDKGEYVLLTAHYDHVGMGGNSGRTTATDSIFNGARDNGMGTVALLAAAEALGQAPPRRSVILIALTGEEIGLLGSRYYAENPLLPLEKTIFNLNTDGGGYNDTSIVSILGFNRVGAAEEMEKACRQFGLAVFADPAPEQNLFDRSDNVSFAVKGVPAPTFSPGFKEFNAEILKYYHQVADEAESVNFRYLAQYSKAYAYAARLIADKAEKPRWAEGDKYEPAGKALYGY